MSILHCKGGWAWEWANQITYLSVEVGRAPYWVGDGSREVKALAKHALNTKPFELA